jgi:hypothetical protein
MQRSAQAQPVYQYSKVLLTALVGAFAAAWLLVVLAMGLPGVVPLAGKLAVSVFLGILATVLWLDFWGYATLRGLVQWRTAQWWKWAAVIGLLIFFPVVVGVYLVRTVLDSRRVRTNGAKLATPPTRFRTTPIGLGTLVGVALLALLVSSVGVGAMTRVASAQGPGTNGGQDTISHPAQPTATSPRHQAPGKGGKRKNGHGHHPHHG